MKTKRIIDGQVEVSLSDDKIEVSITTQSIVLRWDWIKPEAQAWLGMNEYLLKDNRSGRDIPIAGRIVSIIDAKSLIRSLRHLLKQKKKPMRKTSVLEREVLRKFGRHIQSQFLSCVAGKYNNQGMIDQYDVITKINECIVNDFLLDENITDSSKLLDLINSGKITVLDIYQEEDALWCGIDEYFTGVDFEKFEREIVIPLLKSKNLEWIESGQDVQKD